MVDINLINAGGMGTLQDLKCLLRSKAESITTSSRQTLSDAKYSTGFDILLQHSTCYPNFIFPQLTQLLAPLLDSRKGISVLEIGPGPKSVLGGLPDYQKRKIHRYEAFEPNQLFAESLEAWLSVDTVAQSRFPCLKNPPTIHRLQFDPQHRTRNGSSDDMPDGFRGYDVILFCHSMYGMPSKGDVIKQTLKLLAETRGGVLAVFHRGESLHVDGLICRQTAAYPIGVVRVADEDHMLDDFAPFIAGFVMHDEEVHKAVQVEWRKVCRDLAYREEAHSGCLSFRSPDVMLAFSKHATKLSNLTMQLPALLKEGRKIKNREACLHRPAVICRPTEIDHIQQCIRWALENGTGLTIIGGGHSGHCIWDNIASVDMSAFHRVYIHTTEEEGVPSDIRCSGFVMAEAGCTTGDVITKAMAAGVTVPLGSRPSVGAGLWLQGGIGHLTRKHGLASDAIVGAVMVSVDSGEVLCVGYVPSMYRPAAFVRPENEADILWALKGAGTNFGIVVNVIFRAYTAPKYLVRNWAVPLSGVEAEHKLSSFDTEVASKLSRDCSADVYLYWDHSQLHVGVTMIASTTTMRVCAECPISTTISTLLGAKEDSVKIVDGVGLFETEMYVSKMHGGHGAGKTSSFKRCLFLKDISNREVAGRLIAAVKGRPSSLCYLHLLQGGGAISDVAANANAFGDRDWDFACVITGVWRRDQEGTEAARAAVAWVYSVAEHLLPISRGVYSADLGPDPRDVVLSHRAFGVNRQRLGQLKVRLDPQNVLAYTCPLPKAPLGPKLILVVTGQSCAGKDYCANVWVSMFVKCSLTARAVSISEAIKREFAVVTGADTDRLLSDRAYKEQHRTALTAYFLDRVQHEPQLPEEQFLQVVNDAADVGVLLITGMRDKTPVAAFAHLVPNSRLVEVCVNASAEQRRLRKNCPLDDSHGASHEKSAPIKSSSEALTHNPCLIFDNETPGNKAANMFFEDHLFPLVHEDLLRLADMVRSTPDFPRQNIVFRHVLGISQQPGGLALCTSLLQSYFAGDWSTVTAIACCEVGGIVFASPLSLQVNIPLVLIRQAGKLPPPINFTVKSQSHVSSLSCSSSGQTRIEIECSAVPRSGRIVVIDDTLATGETLCSVLQTLHEAGVATENLSVMVVAEFPIHCGRKLLCKRGFSRVNVRSLLSFDGA